MLQGLSVLDFLLPFRTGTIICVGLPLCFWLITVISVIHQIRTNGGKIPIEHLASTLMWTYMNVRMYIVSWLRYLVPTQSKAHVEVHICLYISCQSSADPWGILKGGYTYKYMRTGTKMLRRKPVWSILPFLVNLINNRLYVVFATLVIRAMIWLIASNRVLIWLPRSEECSLN